MKDIEKLKILLNDFGVEYSEKTDNDNKTLEIITESGNNKVNGYCGFLTAFEFNLDGSFIQMGAWE